MPGPVTSSSMDLRTANDQDAVILTRPRSTPACFSAAKTPSMAESTAFTRQCATPNSCVLSALHFSEFSRLSGSFSKTSTATAGCQALPLLKPALKPFKVAAFHASKQSNSMHLSASRLMSVLYPEIVLRPSDWA